MRKINLLLVFILILGLITSCSTDTPTTNEDPNNTPAAEIQPTNTPTTNAGAPSKGLTVCLGQEPNTLFPFADPNTAAKTILGTMYDGPIDVFSTGDQPVILEKLPSAGNQDVQVITTPAKKGTKVVDINGDVVSLDIGRTILPTGCRDESCAIVYDGRSDIEMDQMLITYRLNSNIEWSDGTALTAEDYIFAFNVAKDPASLGSKFVVSRTFSYETLDTHSVQWWGIPGYLADDPAKVLLQPLPKAQLASYSVNEMMTKTGKEILPISWGPYILEEWSAGNYVHLVKNLNYFKSGEGLPYFEELNFLFVDSPQEAITALISKKCDILDSSTSIEGELPFLQELQKNEFANVITSTTPMMETIDFRIGPSGITIVDPGLKDPFSDVNIRQAVAYCIDRRTIVDSVLLGQTEIPDSYVPPTHPNYSDSGKQYTFDTLQGNSILELAGWVRDEAKENSPRIARGIIGIPEGTQLVFNYMTTDTPLRRRVSEMVASSLAQCGIGVDIHYVEPSKFYAQTAEGSLFGRNFDLVEYSTGSYDKTDPCLRLMASQNPTTTNKWFGSNISGYSNPDFDALCSQAINDAGQSDTSLISSGNAQQIYANDLPSIPLFLRMKVIASQKNICNISLDPYSPNDLWNIENFKIGSDCQQ